MTETKHSPEELFSRARQEYVDAVSKRHPSIHKEELHKSAARRMESIWKTAERVREEFFPSSDNWGAHPPTLREAMHKQATENYHNEVLSMLGAAYISRQTGLLILDIVDEHFLKPMSAA